MRKVRGRGLLEVFAAGTAPAETWMSSRKLSLSEANFLSASSKASSLNPAGPVTVGVGGCTTGALIVAELLLLLAGAVGSAVLKILPILFLASKLYRDRLFAVSVGEPGVVGRAS